jgi:hypothetical protein
MIRTIEALLLAVLVSCASSSGALPNRESAAPIDGAYEYTVNVPGQQVKGTLRIVGDTILVEPLSEYCQPIPGPADPESIRYRCSGPGSLMLKLHRRDPLRSSTWSGTFGVSKLRQVCTRYGMENDKQVCLQSRQEPFEAKEARSGALRVRRTT